MNDSFITEFLRCPCCKKPMTVANSGTSLVCLGERVHSFDFSSKGYVNLSRAQSATGDSKEAVRSRSDFLNKGYYAPIAEKLVEILKSYKDVNKVLDAGCGEGYYTSYVAEAGYLTSGFDLSKFAVASTASRMNCKRDMRHFAAVASVFELPVCDSSTDAVVSIFAPCAEEEFRRVLKDDGLLIVVSAGEDHLMGLKRAIYSEAYRNDARSDMPKNMELDVVHRLKYTVDLSSNEDVLNLFSMTPYYWRTSQKDKEKLLTIDSLTTEVDVLFSVYKK